MIYHRELAELKHITRWGEFWAGTRHTPEYNFLSDEILKPLYSSQGQFQYDPTKLLFTEEGEGSFGLFEEKLYPSDPEFLMLLKRALENFNARLKENPMGFAHFAVNCYFTSKAGLTGVCRTTKIKIKNTGAILEVTFSVSGDTSTDLHFGYTDRTGNYISVSHYPISFLYFQDYIKKNPDFGKFINMWSESIYSSLHYKYITKSEEVVFSGLYTALKMMGWEYDFIWEYDASMTALPELLVNHLMNPTHIPNMMDKMKGAYYGSHWLTLLLTKEESKPLYNLIVKGRRHDAHLNTLREIITNTFYQLSLGREIIYYSDWIEDKEDKPGLNEAIRELFDTYRGDPFYLWLSTCWTRPDIIEYNLIEESTNLQYTLALNSFTELEHLAVSNRGGLFSVMNGTTPYGTHTGVVKGLMMGKLEENIEEEERQLGHYRLNELISLHSPLIPDRLKGYTEEDNILRILYPVYYLETQGDTLGYHVSFL